MNIMLNDAAFDFSGDTLEDLLDSLGKETKGIAVAIDQQVVPKSLWSNTELNEQSQVFIFESIAGG
ncbi:thiamine biosynthesis protein ThiS [Marinomonas primoryensis]|uniref:Thiamine biosynthesis protein ThiS n=1 Tax=Marinomonas primoryensis TaxID=178399 RepID=A0A2Z4PU43_9GAMM|nr:sulfur carrier protein ThiS [Marinomonas primoryensis]AWY00970.1 thiamine biosynthesis protein ThiS [Marinomonas primoryensis]